MKFLLPHGTPKGQSDAVNANDRKITVGAGAGTGKTWVLTERYLRLLLDNDDILPGEILTLTYTEAAAGEMKSRITSGVESRLKEIPDSERKHEILDGLSDLWVSTIHSFAARLIREYGLSLNIDPKASVITPQQEQDFWNNIARAAEFANLSSLARIYGNKEILEMAIELDANKDFSACAAKWKANTLSRFACAAAELHASSGFSWHKMDEWLKNDDLLIASAKESVKNIMLPEWKEVWEIFAALPVLPMPRGQMPQAVGVIFNDMLARYRGKKADEDTMKNFYAELFAAKSVNGQPFIALKPFLGNMPLGKWKETRPQDIVSITQQFDSQLTDEEIRVRKVLLKFCALSWAMWDKMKIDRGLLSFSDMINHARTAIKDNGIKRSFRHILVDEFQDTDRLQFDMINSLITDEKTLFAVGDPKQSIYRFRYADPSLFRETIEDSDKSIELDTSFRTRAKLIAKINALFSAIWANGLGRSDSMRGLKYQSINAVTSGTGRDSGTMPDFMIILSPHDNNTLEQGRKNLADELARNIVSWVSSEKTIWDKHKKIIRPVKFSDFAILVPARSIYPILEESLERFGIKSIQDKSTDYFARGELHDIVCLLRAAADMNDDFAVSGWLMSPFSGVNQDDAVKCLTLADKDTRPIELIRRKFPEAYLRLEYYALVGEHEGSAGLISLFDRNRKWLSAYKPSDRMRVLRNLRLAVSVAGELQKSETMSLVSCAEWLTRTVHNEVSYEEPAWHDESENAVRLGTVHSAKGLEYPVAVVFDPRVKKKIETSSLRPSRELGLVFTKIPDEITKGKEITPKLSAWEKLLSEQGEDEEQTRLFYVAATRAQDSLIFCGMIDANKSTTTTPVPHAHTWTKLLLDNISVLPDYDNDSQCIRAHEIPDHVPESMNHEENQESLRQVSIVKAKNSLRQISATSFALYEWCPFAWRRSYRQGLTLTWEDPADKAEDYDGYSGGAEVGSLVHWILSRWPRSEDYEAKLDFYLTDREVLSRLPSSLKNTWRKIDKSPDSQLRKWLMKFAASDLGVMLRTQSDIAREKLFRIPLNESTSLAGAIDAVYGNNIIDYKITSIDKTPPGLYESQLDFYAFVIHEQTGAEKVNACIVFLREGKTEQRIITDFEAIRARIISASEVCASGPYTPNIKNCGLCPFKKGCVKNNAGI